MAQFQQFRLGDALSQGQSARMNALRLQEADRSIQAREGLQTAVQDGSPQAMQSYSAQFPAEAMDYESKRAQAGSKKMELLEKETNMVGAIAATITDQGTYDRAKSMIQSAGIDVSQYPQQYDPAFVKQQVDIMNARKEQALKSSNRGVQFLPTTEGYMVGDLASGGISKPSAGMFMPPQYSPALQEGIAEGKARGKGKGELETAGPLKKAEESAKLEVEKEKARPKAKLAMENARQRSTRVMEAIDRALPRVNSWTAGLAGAALDSLAGSPARDLRADIDTIRANIGFDELNAMRQSSPTGGALGQVSERELAFLQSVLTNLEQSQSPGQLRRNLGLAKKEIKDSWDRVQRAYEADYGEDVPKVGPGGGSVSPQSYETKPKSKYSDLWGD